MEIPDIKTACKCQENNGTMPNTDKLPEKIDNVKSRIIYNLDDVVLQHINIDKNLVLRVIENANGKFIDIRRFYKEYPTKKGIRFTFGTFEKLKDLLK